MGRRVVEAEVLELVVALVSLEVTSTEGVASSLLCHQEDCPQARDLPLAQPLG